MSQAAGRPVPRPREERFVLAVDLGTSVVKVGLVSLTGRVAWWDQTPLQTLREPDGAVSQDAEEWWRVVACSTRQGLAESMVPSESVVAVSVTGEWGSTVPVDADGRPVGPCVLYTDTRGRQHAREVFGGAVQGYAARPLATWLRRSGGIPSPNGGDPVAHMLHLSRDRPEVAGEARWYLETVDYVTMRFTGVAAACHASMTAAWLTDNRRLDRLAYDERLLEMARLDRSRLPPLVPTGSVVGTVLPAVAAELGIPQGARVVTGLPDLHATAVGLGCVRDYEAHMVVGTTAWVSCPFPRKKSDVVRQMAAVPGLSNDHYLIANNQDAAGRCLEWFRDHVLARLTPDGHWTYDELTALAAGSPSGAGGVIFTPWLVGERSPVDDRSARGGFHNLSMTTDLADLARAVLEGVAYNAAWLLAGVDHFTGRRLEPLRLAGGGARSDLWCQILADVLDRRIERPPEPVLAGLRGAALFAAMVLGEVGRDEVRALVPVDRVFAPDPVNRGTYDSLFREFPGLYKRQRRMFHRLNG